MDRIVRFLIAIEEHPFTLNPIIWIVLVAVFFIGIVIFYYAASS